MYEAQRRDALADWAMQNEYNSPSAQMARLKQAGLNPNLVYGSGADVTAGPVRSADAPSWSPRAPQFDLGSVAYEGMTAYQNMEIKEAQVDNLRMNNSVMEAEKLLKSAQVLQSNASTAKTLQDLESSEFELELKNDLRSINMEAARLGVEKQALDIDKIMQDMRLAVRADERAQISNDMSVREGAMRIISMRIQNAKTEQERRNLEQMLMNLDTDNQIKLKDKEWREKGITPGDPWYWRWLNELIFMVNPKLEKVAPADGKKYYGGR